MEYGLIAIVIVITVRLIGPWRKKNEHNAAHRKKVAMFGIAFLVVIFSIIGYFAYLQDKEFKQIDQWLISNNLNEYGDENGTQYPNGEPLIYDQNGQAASKYTIIKQRFPEKPWVID